MVVKNKNMKNHLIILVITSLFSVFNIHCNAQKYYAFPDSNAVWSVYWQRNEPSFPPSWIWTTYKYGLFGDTVINNMNYHKLYENDYDSIMKINNPDNYYIGALREMDKKIYYLIKDSILENIIYDFNIHKINDTVIISNHRFKFICQKIDSILINNKYRKMYYMDAGFLYMGSSYSGWIEGIGSDGGLLFPFLGGNTEFTTSNLLCFHQNNTLIYNDLRGTCYTKGEYPDNVVDLTILNCKVVIYPNPANSLLVVSYSLLEKTNVSLNIYDLLGNQVLSLVNQEQWKGENKIEFNTEKLNNGIYFCKMQAGNSLMTKKIVVMH